MIGRALLLDERVGPFAGQLGRELLRRYAEATSDRSPGVRAGEVVPPVALVTQIWEAQERGRTALVSDALQQTATGGVHGEHDVVLHRPLLPGEPLRIWVEGHGIRPAGRNTAVTLRYTAVDASDAVVAEQWWTTILFGVTAEPASDAAPDHAFPAGARERPVGTWDTVVDPGMATRYAEVSGDWSPHHFEVEAAQRSGFERIFLHGLCTMALCAQGVTALVADGDPARLRRIAVRFASPTFIGERLHLRLYDAGPLGYAFEADSAGALVIAHGRAELR